MTVINMEGDIFSASLPSALFHNRPNITGANLNIDSRPRSIWEPRASLCPRSALPTALACKPGLCLSSRQKKFFMWSWRENAARSIQSVYATRAERTRAQQGHLRERRINRDAIYPKYILHLQSTAWNVIACVFSDTTLLTKNPSSVWRDVCANFLLLFFF